jgi:DNA-binding transcriptional MerR regulator
VTADELLTIGRFARISGLTAHALRHYDDVGLLTPAEVDPQSGYRLYRREQVRYARVIQALRQIDLPIEEIKEALGDPEGPTLKTILRRHRDRLHRQQNRVSDQVAQVDRFIEKGLTMSATTNARPVQLKLAVDDVDAAVTFYQRAFGFHYDVTRRTGEDEFSGFVFGNYGDADFFLVHQHCPDDFDRVGPSNFGLLVDDLDVALARAVDAGAVQVVPIQDLEGMPRCCAVKDPSGNWIWLYQG